MSDPQRPFADLPAALVEEVLEQTALVSDIILSEFTQFKKERKTMREALKAKGLLRHESSLGYPPLPTTCGTDGSYAIERLLSTDLAAAAAVAVEGLTPPSEKRFWDEPRHSTFIAAERHEAETATILRAVMLGRELELATKAPHDLVMLDMTLTLPIIYLNQALNQAPLCPLLKCSHEFVNNCLGYLKAYATTLRCTRSDKHFIALPKYSSRREIGFEMQWPTNQDDRGALTLILEPGEFTRAMPLEKPQQAWHLYVNRLPSSLVSEAQALASDITEALNQTHVFHYKPHAWLPALRIETSADAAKNDYRLAAIIQGLKHQCAAPGMLEPYPLCLADRTVKALARSLPMFRQVATQHMAEQYDGDVGEVFFAMHGYRSDSGGQ